MFLAENKIPVESPNPKNKDGGIVLSSFGFQPVIQRLINQVITPIAKKLWSGMGEDSLRDHIALATAYKAGETNGLGLHREEAEISVNCCLGATPGVEGGDVLFKGTRCREHAFIESEDDA